MGEPFDVFGDGDDLLEVLVLAVEEDGIVDNYAMDGSVVVYVYQGFFDGVLGYGEEGVADVAGRRRASQSRKPLAETNYIVLEGGWYRQTSLFSASSFRPVRI